MGGQPLQIAETNRRAERWTCLRVGIPLGRGDFPTDYVKSSCGMLHRDRATAARHAATHGRRYPEMPMVVVPCDRHGRALESIPSEEQAGAR